MTLIRLVQKFPRATSVRDLISKMRERGSWKRDLLCAMEPHTQRSFTLCNLIHGENINFSVSRGVGAFYSLRSYFALEGDDERKVVEWIKEIRVLFLIKLPSKWEMSGRKFIKKNGAWWVMTDSDKKSILCKIRLKMQCWWDDYSMLQVNMLMVMAPTD